MANKPFILNSNVGELISTKYSNPVQEIIESIRKLRRLGVEPDTIKVNPALLTPENLPRVIALCEKLEIPLKLYTTTEGKQIFSN